MNKWYFTVPFAALVVFYIYFRQFDKADEAALREKEHQAEIAKQAKLEEERQLRLKAVEEAKAQIEARRAEQAKLKAEREAEEARREEDRITLERSKTEESQLKVELKDLRDEVADEEDLLKRALDRKTAFEAERQHVLAYNETALKNKDRFLQLIDKIEESEKAKAAAAAAAAAAAKK